MTLLPQTIRSKRTPGTLPCSRALKCSLFSVHNGTITHILLPLCTRASAPRHHLATRGVGGAKGGGGAGIGDVQIARAINGEVRENGAGTFSENCSTVTGAVTPRRR